MVSRHDPSVVYYTGNLVFKTTDAGMSWKPISPDLTRNDKAKQQRSGGPITRREHQHRVLRHDLQPAPSRRSQKDLLWAGSDDGLVHLTRDGGAHLGQRDAEGPAGVEPDQQHRRVAARSGDGAISPWTATSWTTSGRTPRVTHDYGKTWTRIAHGIPAGSFVRAVREDPRRKGLLYAGTETGVFVSFDDGARFQPLKLNLPTVPVHDLVVKGDDLVLATHGRAFWILDDLAPLRQWTDAAAKADVHLFEPSPPSASARAGTTTRSRARTRLRGRSSTISSPGRRRTRSRSRSSTGAAAWCASTRAARR